MKIGLSMSCQGENPKVKVCNNLRAETYFCHKRLQAENPFWPFNRILVAL